MKRTQPACALTDADIENLPNYVAAEWEKPDIDDLLVAQRRMMSTFASEFVLKLLPQEIINADFIDDDNVTKDNSEGNLNPTVVSQVTIHSGLVTVQMEVIGGGLPIPIYSFTRPYSD